jgi:hypothetical protein
MATKTYRKQGALLRSLNIPVELEKGNTRVTFVGGGISPTSGNCSFSTNNEALQKALEKHKLFNDPDGFVLEHSTGDATTGDDGKTPVAEVKNFASAKEYILKNYKGYTQADVSNAEKVRALAGTLGITFPNWET